MNGPERPEGGAITHCEWCGADYEADGPAPPARVAPRPAPAPAEAAEPATHCEWCGAEYPVPGG
ncbi:MAG: hypothetical protein MUE51_02790 [Thermoleophilia bacterium]|jgi:redox-regulated HSP33 family molecular chaperone|nr:hypothetical protein [Thermoleophilia bacterium]